MSLRRAILPLLLALAALALLAPATAPAHHAEHVLEDCRDDGELQGRHSDRALREALRQLRGDADEYSYCADVINAALRGGPGSARRPDPGGAPPAPGTGLGSEPTAEDEAAIAQAVREGAEARKPPEVSVDGKKVTPTPVSGSAGAPFEPASAANRLPAPLTFALIALAVLAGILAAPAVRRAAGGPRAALRRLRG